MSTQQNLILLTSPKNGRSATNVNVDSNASEFIPLAVDAVPSDDKADYVCIPKTEYYKRSAYALLPRRLQEIVKGYADDPEGVFRDKIDSKLYEFVMKMRDRGLTQELIGALRDFFENSIFSPTHPDYHFG